MIPDNTTIYLETSAINHLADNYSYKDARATFTYHILKGTKFYISNVTIWEILLTSDTKRREKLIKFIQSIGYERLINSPSEFIINYITNGLPLHEGFYDFHSKLPIHETWKNLCKDRDQTFQFDETEIKERSQIIRRFFKWASKQIDEIIILDPKKSDKLDLSELITTKAKSLKRVNYDELPPDNKAVTRLTILLILLILCNEVALDNEPIREFWNDKNIHSTFLRFDKTMSEMEILATRGPIRVLATMAYVQLKEGGKPTRGIFWDVMHSIYLIYTDIFLTNDSHFKHLRDENTHVIFQRIIHLDEVKFFTAKEIKITE